MDSIKSSLDELTAYFHTRMDDFQKEIRCAIPATSPTSNINSQFNSFRTFVMNVLENLQLQVQLLSRQQDEMDMFTRKKILLVHGVSEGEKENTVMSVSSLLSEKLNLPQITSDSISRCHRLGRNTGDKPRAILIKFKDISLKHKVWSSKTSLKGTGVTISEFLTKVRHNTFVAARQRFGISKCWTRDGAIIVLDAEGTKHRVTSMSELEAICVPAGSQDLPTAADVKAPKPSSSKVISSRTKRVLKK